MPEDGPGYARPLRHERFLLNTLPLLALAALPIALSVLTWKWLGGREERTGTD